MHIPITNVAAAFCGEKLKGESVWVSFVVLVLLPHLDVSPLAGCSFEAIWMEGYIAVAAMIHPSFGIHLRFTLVAVEITRTVESGVVRQRQLVVLVPSRAGH